VSVIMGDGEARGQTAHSISAVLADIDGTLVTKEKVLTERAIRAVDGLRQRMGSVLPSHSSRPITSRRQVVERAEAFLSARIGESVSIAQLRRVAAAASAACATRSTTCAA
jgi:ribonucleotide monophosphatase NagD (HAD superfamily)